MTINRAQAAMWSKAGLAGAAVCAAGALYVGTVGLPVEPAALREPAPTPPAIPEIKVELPKSVGIYGVADTEATGARLAMIANVPKTPDPPPPVDNPDTPVTVEPPPPVADAFDGMRYVGPVRVPGRLLAILRVADKQQVRGPGRSVTNVVEGVAKLVEIVEVTETDVLLRSGTEEKRLVMGERAGDVVSFLGGKGDKSVPKAARTGRGAPRVDAEGQAEGRPPLDGRSAMFREIVSKIEDARRQGGTMPMELFEQLREQAKQAGGELSEEEQRAMIERLQKKDEPK